MGQQLAAFAELPSHFISTRIGVGPLVYRLRYTYRPRMKGWYFDLFNADGTRLIVGRRLSPLSLPLDFAREGLPEGVVLVSGPSDYQQADLGVTLSIRAFTEAELEATIAELAEAALPPLEHDHA